MKIRLLRALRTSDVSGSRLAYAPGSELNSSAGKSRGGGGGGCGSGGGGGGGGGLGGGLRRRVAAAAATAGAGGRTDGRTTRRGCAAPGLRFDPERLNLGRPTVTPPRGGRVSGAACGRDQPERVRNEIVRGARAHAGRRRRAARLRAATVAMFIV